MRAWLMDSYEGVEKLRLGEVPDPQPGPGQVLLRIKFAALNPADAFLAQAMYPAKPSLPHILGRDGVGEVVAVGPGVGTCAPARRWAFCAAMRAWKPGERLPRRQWFQPPVLLPCPKAGPWKRWPELLWSFSPHGRL